jgi:predicted Zn-dependent protease
MGEINPESKPRAYAHMIDTLRFLRSYDEAREMAEKAAKEFPEDRALILLRAQILAETGDVEQASEALRTLLKNGPEDRGILVQLAHIYEKGKRYDEAVEAVEKAAEYSKTETERLDVLFTHASVLERAKRYEQAEAKFRELIEAQPDNASALNYLGYMLADLDRNLDDAHDMIQRALDIEPGNGAYLDSLGWLYYRQKKFDLAERYLLRSLEKVKRDPVVHSHLGDVYFEQGKVDQAKKHWERSLQEWKSSAAADQDPKEIAKVQAKLEELALKISSTAKPEKQSKP